LLSKIVFLDRREHKTTLIHSTKSFERKELCAISDLQKCFNLTKKVFLEAHPSLKIVLY